MTESQRYRNYQILKWLGWPLFIFSMFFKGCSCEGNSQQTTKAHSGTFKPAKPNNANLGSIDTIRLTKFVKSKPIIEYKNNEVNKELAIENYNLQIAYINAKDSLEREKLYKNSIELKSFNQLFENDNFKANVKGIVQGEVKEIQLDYEIKNVPEKVVKFRLLAGLGINTDAVNANLGFQNKKGSIFEVGYDTQKRINIGYKVSLFKISK